MIRKSGDQLLDELERRFQALRDQLATLPEAGGLELATALQKVSEAIAALRAAGGSPAAEAPDRPAAADSPAPADTILRHVFNAIPDMLNVIDRDFNIIMSNWHESDRVPEVARRGRPKCYQVYHHRERPCEDCHSLAVFATGQPQKVEKTNDLDGRVLEFSVFPILDESGQVSMVVEHVRDIQERHIAEQALRESEDRFRTLIEDSPESLFLTDVQGTILAASRVAARRLGKNLTQVIGVSTFDLFPPEVAVRRRVMFEQAVATGRPVRLEDARGNRHFDVTINPILDADGKVSKLSILGIDITDRKNAEQALKESEERFRAIFATAQDTIFIKDRSFRYTQVNPAMERLFGRPAAEIIGKTDLDLVGAADTERIRKQDRRVLNGEVVKGAHTVPVQGVPITFHYIKAPLHDEAGEIVGICGIARDITDLKQAEAALKESEERFRMLFDHVPDAYILADMQGEIIDCNQATKELAGFDREELVGNNFACLTWLDFRQQVRLADLLAQTARGEVMGPVDFTLTRKDGGEVSAEGMSLPLYIQGQNLVLTIVRDITARRRAEEELFKHHLELQETAQRLEQSRNMLQLIIESIPVRVFWKDRDLRYLGCNTLFARDAGFDDPQQLLGKDDFAMGWREQAHLYNMADRQVMESLRPKMNFVEPQTTPAGAQIWLKTSKVPLHMPNGEVLGVLGVYEDITTHKQAEEALRESEARFRHISSTSSDISYSFKAGSDGSYAIDWLVGAVERITGYSEAEIQAQRCWKFLVIEAD
jgi:PAS domain S-box-containing protein